ncbi:DoxX family protein [Gandjariella thermophila]|uniref:DoxX family protein n=1 Tax=Gandjariella thermophila TaxID=1931992 RepID=A0A4D4J063_9PSEU|nr:DoxX family protein [Gandjariella thermophila]GDY28744.1 hypothetical protein GTS_03770 [Gandjariella thermophila]
MNVTLWILQALLAAIFAVSGACKSVLPKERLVAMGQTGVAPFPLPLVRFTAVCELFGVVGIILPWLTHTAAVLTPLAATGFAVVMVGAIGSHAYLKEPRSVVATTVILAMAVTVAIGRFAGLG